ncbi:MAG: hypothetical protein K8T10_18030 [Candidatus Eremiobacteraeota bacterium]|nr:hypothetical protein [Candidatus Eremiobacteraeota bacterium]
MSPERGNLPDQQGMGQPENKDYAGVPTPSAYPAGGTVKDGDSSKKKSCLFGMGCVGCGMFGCLGFIILSLVGIFAGIHWFKNTFISDRPLEMPSVYLSEKEEKKLTKKLYLLKKAIDNEKEEVVSLELTPDELNYQFQNTKGKKSPRMFIKIHSDDKMSVKLSIPYQPAEPRQYLNITTKGKIEVDDYRFKLKLDSFMMGKLKFPKGDFMEEFSKSFAREISSNPEYEKLPVKLKKLKVKDNKLLIEVKIKPVEVPGPSTNYTESPTDEPETKTKTKTKTR